MKVCENEFLLTKEAIHDYEYEKLIILERIDAFYKNNNKNSKFINGLIKFLEDNAFLTPKQYNTLVNIYYNDKIYDYID
jgi:hypothetical protein